MKKISPSLKKSRHLTRIMDSIVNYLSIYGREPTMEVTLHGIRLLRNQVDLECSSSAQSAKSVDPSPAEVPHE